MKMDILTDRTHNSEEKRKPRRREIRREKEALFYQILHHMPNELLEFKDNEMVAVKFCEAELSTETPEARSSEIVSSSLVVDTSLPLSEMKSYIVELCKDLFEQWSNFDHSHFSVETISGGITNLLLKVTVTEEDGSDVSVTIRLYGPNTDYVINREREMTATTCLSAAGFGAKVLATFGNGMIQSFINARTLSPKDMRNPKLVIEIAKQLHMFHQVEVPGSKEPQLWNDMDKFFTKASNLSYDHPEKQLKYNSISFEELDVEINELKEFTLLLKSPVVFAHNDLLSGNLMLNEEHWKLFVIDFEYGSYNYRGFDIGNHFNEYAGYDCDYSLYPSKEEQYHFFRHYLYPDAPQEATDSELEALYVEANSYMLGSHLYWALWALIQAKMSPIDFDYLGYFFLRYNEYKRKKGEVLSTAKSFISTF